MQEKKSPPTIYNGLDGVNTAKEKEKQDNIKATLQNYYGQMVEAGRPDHIITNNEAQQIFGVKNSQELNKLFSSAFTKVHTFNDVLRAAGLPCKKEKNYY